MSTRSPAIGLVFFETVGVGGSAPSEMSVMVFLFLCEALNLRTEKKCGKV